MNISKMRNSLKDITVDIYAKEVKRILEKADEVKTIMNLKDSDIEKLIDKGYTFSEILAGSFNDKGEFIPEEIIMKQTKEYLVKSNQFNVYANQGNQL